MTPERPTVPVPVCVVVNGQRHDLVLDPRRGLADVLRRDLGLYGTHEGCDQGVCGACTVLVDGEPVRSCLMLAAQADGAKVETVESLASEGQLNALQRAFAENHGVQCGFCTPGYLMLATAFLRAEPGADPERVREVVSANLCRCTGYAGIIDAIKAAAAAGGRS